MYKSLFSAFIIVAISFFVLYDGAFVLEKSKDLVEVNDNYDEKSVGVYLINLDRAKNRLDKIIPMVTHLDLPFERVAAVDGKDLSRDVIDGILSEDSYLNYVNSFPDVGSVGCYMSHIDTLKRFLRSSYEYALILEDDVSFNPKELRSVIDQLIEKNKYWDTCGFNLRHRGMPLKICSIGDHLQLSTYAIHISSSGAYLIDRKAALSMVQHAYPIKMPIDMMYSRYWELDIKFRGIDPRIVHQTFGDSYINNSELVSKEATGNIFNKIHRAVFHTKTSIMRFVLSIWEAIENQAD